MIYGLLSSAAVFAQTHRAALPQETVETLNATPKMAIGVSEERTVHSAFKLYEHLKESGVQIEDFEIVIWGKVVADLKDGTVLAEFIKPYLNTGLSVKVCQVALQKLKVDPKDLPKGITVTPTAYARLFELQALGYNVLVP